MNREERRQSYTSRITRVCDRILYNRMYNTCTRIVGMEKHRRWADYMLDIILYIIIFTCLTKTCLFDYNIKSVLLNE